MAPATTSARRSATTDARFEARARAARRRSRRPLLVAAVALLVVALAAVAYLGPILVVRRVEVTGLRAQPGIADVRQARAQVAAIGAAERGRPLMQVRGGQLQTRAQALPFVADVRVERSWPATLRLVVRPRIAAAAVPQAGRGYRLVDVDARAWATVPARPSGVPLVQVPAGAAGPQSLHAALTVLEGLPADLRRRVGRVSASSPDDVRLGLGRSEVVWGGAGDGALKARVLQDLLGQRAKRYDVSSPHTPVLR